MGGLEGRKPSKNLGLSTPIGGFAADGGGKRNIWGVEAAPNPITRNACKEEVKASVLRLTIYEQVFVDYRSMTDSRRIET